MTGSSKRRLAWASALVIAASSAWAIWIGTARGVASTCEHVLALARAGGERPGEAESAQCLAVMQDRRDAAGWVGWAKLSRCIARAHSLDEAGRCKPR
ncbi:hypothetical protein ACNOYE_28615 [Nannocystaceae bacterium ST9]